MKHRAEYIKNTDKPTPESSHHCWLVHNDIVYKGNDQVGNLCRDLDTGTLEIYRGDMLCLTVNVDKRKTRALREHKHTGLAYAKWMPFPDASSWAK